MLCHAQSHRCRRTHHPCSPQGPTHGRHRAGTRAPSALALRMHGPTAPPKYAPTCKHVPHGCKHPPAWCSMSRVGGDGYTASLPAGQPHWWSPGTPPGHPMPAPHGVPIHQPASRRVPREVPHVIPGTCHGHASQPYTKVFCGKWGVQDASPSGQPEQQAMSRVGMGTMVGRQHEPPSCW